MHIQNQNGNRVKATEKFMGFQLTREGTPSLEGLIEKLQKNYDFFSDMDEKEIVWILRMCGRRSFAPGQTIFEKGDTGNCFYLIVFGEVVIQRGKTELARIGEGHCFGEMAVLDEAPRSATAIAQEDTLLFAIERDILVNVLPSLGFKVAANLARQLSKKLRDVDEFIETNAAEKSLAQQA